MFGVPTFGIIAFIAFVLNNGPWQLRRLCGIRELFRRSLDDENPPDRPKSELTGSNVSAKRPKMFRILQPVLDRAPL